MSRPTFLVLALALAPLLQGGACSLTSDPQIDEEVARQRELLAKASPRKPKSTSPIGTNLAGIADWGTQRPFADLFKQSRAWISNSETVWDDKRPIDVDARGWVKSLKPGQRARSLVAWESGATVTSGEHVVTWAGKGKLDFWPQRTVQVDGNRAVIVVDSSGLAVSITETDPSDPVRDIRVFRKGNEGKLFDPVFLESLRGYSTLRFMDWMLTNEASVVKWSDRAVTEDARWTSKGVPLEVMIALCNEVDADMWLTIPDTWDDAAVDAAARLVEATLEKDLAVYVEHSNEVWNDLFPQAKRAREKGKLKKLSRDENQARLLVHAERSVEIFKIFEGVFAKEPQRLVRTMGAVMPNAWATGVLLSAPGAAAHTDALAIAPYFGHEVKTTNVDDIMKELDLAIDRTAQVIAEHKKVTEKARVKLVAYEGGQHMVAAGPGGPSAEEARLKAFSAANRDPRMKALYTKSLAAWKSAGGGLFVHFFDTGAYGKFGTWGARERVDQPRAQAPKLDALLTFAEGTPAWW